LNADLLQRKSFIVTLGLLTAVAAVTIDMSLPAIPAMVDALATTLPRAQKIVGAFMIGMACGQIPMGLFGDRLGRLPTLYAGITLFAIAGIVVASSSDMTVLLAARFVQGIGAASAIVLSRAILRDIAAGKELARLMSLMTMIFTAAPVVAPTLGALLVAQWGWRAPFIVIAALGVFIIAMIRLNLVETHYPDVNEHPVRQLASSFRQFFAHRQSIFGLLMIVMLPLGFMSVIAVSAAMVVEIYGFTIQQYGLIFACAGISILIGSAVNRWLVTRFDPVQLIGLGVAMIFAAGAQLGLIGWLDAAPFWWLWSCVCLYMFTVPIVMSNAMVIALDPLPRIAGVATSIIGTSQNIVAATGALAAAAIYDNSVRNSVLLMACAAIAVTSVFLLRPLIAPGDLAHHSDELVRE
jgi:DHA1 family bicyclomycin/chloramphenicol resistance-like MFS transporter